jgi:short-subunit dehydrogenase
LGPASLVLVNAGFGVSGPLMELTVGDYRRQFETNWFGALNTIYATLDDLLLTRGRLVLVGSVAGHVSLPGGSAYAASKFALRALAEALRPELAPRGVSVTLISPGFVHSEFRQVDNRGQFNPEARDPVPSWLVMPTAKAARLIERAVDRRCAERVVTGHARLAVALSRLSPRLLRWAARRVGVRGRTKRPQA